MIGLARPLLEKYGSKEIGENFLLKFNFIETSAELRLFVGEEKYPGIARVKIFHRQSRNLFLAMHIVC